jgi:hypothetical protein
VRYVKSVLRLRRKGTRRFIPPSDSLVQYYHQLVQNSVWRRTVRETVLVKTPHVTERSIEIITALFCYEKAGIKGVSLKHLKFLIPNVQHSQMHRLGDFLLTRVDPTIRHYRYFLRPETITF